MIEIEHDFSGTFEYERYAEVVNRIKDFERWEIFGKDQSGTYDMYFISLGNVEKPVMMLMTSMHGTEWQPVQYTMYFMEQLRDNTFPDVNFRNELLENYHIIFVPMLNPHGMDRADTGEYGIYTSGNYDARYNANGIELNGDFYPFNKQESRNMKKLQERFTPFTFVDMHMYQPDYGVAYGRRAIMASGQQNIEGYQNATLKYRNEWKNSLENYMGEEITSWSNLLGETSGLARGFFGRQENPYTKFTLSYITELPRPAYRNREGEMKLIRLLTNEEFYKYGFAHVYLFFKTSMMYYEENEGTGSTNNDFKDLVNRIEMEHKTIFLERDDEGLLLSYTEEYDETCNNMIIETELLRNEKGYLKDVIRTKN